MLIRVLQIVERVRVDLIRGGDLLCFEFHLNSVSAFNESPQETKRHQRNEDARIPRPYC